MSSVKMRPIYSNAAIPVKILRCFPGGASGEEPTCNAGDVRDTGSIPGSGRSLGGGHGNPLQYPCLENSMDRGAWWAIVLGIARVRHDLVTKPQHES